MNVIASLKWVEYASQACGTLLSKVAFCSLIGASMGLYLGIDADTAAAASLDQTVGRLTVDFLYPDVTTDVNLGTYNFPTTPQGFTVPFGVGIQYGNPTTPITTATSNVFSLNVTPTGFSITNISPFQIGFVNNDDGIIKVTTLDSSLINAVSFQSESGVTLSSDALVSGANFFQVNLARNSFIDPGANVTFTTSYNNVSEPEPVPEPEPEPLLACGLVAFALTRRAIRTNRSRRSLPPAPAR